MPRVYVNELEVSELPVGAWFHVHSSRVKLLSRRSYVRWHGDVRFLLEVVGADGRRRTLEYLPGELVRLSRGPAPVS